MEIKNIVENQSGYKIQVVRADNGTEYTLSQFNSFVEEDGIEHTLYATTKQGQREKEQICDGDGEMYVR